MNKFYIFTPNGETYDEINKEMESKSPTGEFNTIKIKELKGDRYLTVIGSEYTFKEPQCFLYKITQSIVGSQISIWYLDVDGKVIKQKRVFEKYATM